jgi:leader peptidase (prepilin peptidase) / N-methyltransferase
MVVTVLLLIIIGIIAGGLVNALADDLPHYRRPRLPRYPDGSLRPVTAWLGLTAYLLQQHIAPSGSRLSWRYPLTELGTAVLMIITYLAKLNDPQIPVDFPQAAVYLIYAALFVLITVIDIEHRLILFSVMIPSWILALIDAGLLSPLGPNLQDAIIGALLGFGVFFVMYLGGVLYVHIRNSTGQNIGEVAFGYGDVMMATLTGLMLGVAGTIFAMFITIFLGAFGAAFYLLGRRLIGRRTSMFAALPYGPYIVAGTVIMLLFAQQVRFLLVGW